MYLVEVVNTEGSINITPASQGSQPKSQGLLGYGLLWKEPNKTKRHTYKIESQPSTLHLEYVRAYHK